MAESFAPSSRSADTLARERLSNYGRQATVDKKKHGYAERKINSGGSERSLLPLMTQSGLVGVAGAPS
jgi:hypothetical protein